MLALRKSKDLPLTIRFLAPIFDDFLVNNFAILAGRHAGRLLSLIGLCFSFLQLIGLQTPFFQSPSVDFQLDLDFARAYRPHIMESLEALPTSRSYPWYNFGVDLK